MRLEDYDRLESGNGAEKESAWLALKQIWMDNVDIKRGTGSINGLAQQLDFVTLRDAFMKVESLEKVGDIDLNERVKRILKQRMGEFEKWVEASKVELRKRFEVERIYLRNQVSSLKLYARWAKPYLKAARQLEQRMDPDASVVNLFNTTLMQLTVLGEREIRINEEVGMGNLPEMILNVPQRKYVMLVVSELKFRSVPDRNDQRGGYQFRGRVDLVFTSYALNEDELVVLKDQVDRDDLKDLFGLMEGATDESLAKIEVDIDDLLEGKSPEQQEKEKQEAQELKDQQEKDTNPFTALFTPFKRKKSSGEDFSPDQPIPEDTEYEKAIRSQAIIESRARCAKFYGTFKKTYQMPAF